MKHQSLKHDAIWARQLAAKLKLEGYPVKELLAQVGLHERALIAEGGRIPITKYAAFFELAADATGDDFLGVHFGQTRDTRDSGLIGYIGLSSPTVMEVIENTGRYCRVLSEAVEIETTELKEQGVGSWWYNGLEPQKSRQFVEFAASNYVRALRQMTGRRITPVQISLEHIRCGDVTEIERIFACPVRFGGGKNSIKFKIPDLQLHVITADGRLLNLLRRYSQDLLLRHSLQNPSLVATVERLLAERLTLGRASLKSIATEIGMSSRSLSRRLAELDTSFSDVIENLRKDLAIGYLHENDLNFTEIAFLLGYSDVSAFDNAFKRWFGKTPTEFRRELKI